MHAGQLIDSLEPFSATVAEGWITAVLAEAAALGQHDESLWPTSRDAHELQVAHQLRDAWSRWADDAEHLLNRIKALGLSAPSIPRSQELSHTLGRTRAMLKLTPEMMLDRQERIDRWEVMTIQEVRRELQLGQFYSSGRPLVC